MDLSGLNKSIFKTYDIRGIYPSDLNGETAYWTGMALGQMIGKGPVALGRDMRLGGNELFANVLKGLQDSGVDVCDIGLVPIDAVYFAVSFLSYSGGVMITASHNPKEYNGFKMVMKKGRVMEWIRGTEVLEFLSKNDFPDLEVKSAPSQILSDKTRVGEATKRDIWKEYIDHILKFADVSKIKPLKVVVDAGNGMAGKVIPMLEKRLPIEVIPLFFKLDGRFPNHPSNPLMPESQVVISQKVLETHADFGVIFDGDADRLFFVDEKGSFIRADMTLLLLAKLMLEREPGAAIVYNAICSKIVREQVAKWGGRPIRSAVGYANVTQAMRENGAIVSGELSSHYAFRENGCADSGFIAFLILLELISQSSEPLSEMIRPFQKYYKGDEVNFPLASLSSGQVIQAISEKYGDGKQDRLDGLTVEYPDWWVNVRPSNTEPLLRVTMEANTREIFEAKKEEVLGFINSLRTQ